MSLMSAIRDDVAGFWANVAGTRRDEGPPRGLLTYRREAHGGVTRLHLRVQDDGSAMLFKDVTDALHLTSTAAEMMWMALEGWDERRAVARLRRLYRASHRRLDADYRRMRDIVETLSDPRVRCSSCALELPTVPLFSVRARAPHKVDLALTYACNNRCPHCYNDPSRFDMRAMTVDEWKHILDRLAEVGVPHVIFTGGEATVYRGLPELIAHAEAHGMMTGLNSNGRRLVDAAYVKELAEAGLDHVQITLESHVPEVHDAMVGARAFDETVRGIRTVIEEPRLHALTNTTLTRLNVADASDTVRFLHELGLSTFAMNGMIYSGGGGANPDAIPQHELPAALVDVRDTADELGMRFLWYTVTEYCEMSPVELEIGAKRCNAGEYSMCIEPNGDVLPCQSYYTSAGNMLRDSWETIWRGELFRSFRDREEDPRWAGLPDKCHECPDLPVCGGGCRIEREAKDGKAPGGCQSCASGGSVSRGIRSTGISAAPRCTCETDATSCASDVHRGALVAIRVPRGEASA